MRRRYRRQGRRSRVLLFLILPFCMFLFIYIFETRIRPVIRNVAEAKAQSVAVSIINDAVNQIIITKGIEYKDFMTLERDASNRLQAVTSNIVEINRLKSELAVNIQERMRNVDNMTTTVPLGTLLSNGMFLGYGPRIKLRLTPIGYATVNIADSFSHAGINQTRHEIHLTITSQVSVLLPISSISTKVSTDFLVAQSVIIGDVPQSYTEVSGVNGEPQDNILNMID